MSGAMRPGTLGFILALMLTSVANAQSSKNFVSTMTTYDSFGNLMTSGNSQPATREGCNEGIANIVGELRDVGQMLGPNAVFIREDKTLRLFSCFLLEDVRDRLHHKVLPDPLTKETAAAWPRFPEVPRDKDLTHRLRQWGNGYMSGDAIESTSDPMTLEKCQALLRESVERASKVHLAQRIDENTYKDTFGKTHWYRCIPAY